MAIQWLNIKSYDCDRKYKTKIKSQLVIATYFISHMRSTIILLIFVRVIQILLWVYS
jgi:hypothetical protein